MEQYLFIIFTILFLLFVIFAVIFIAWLVNKRNQKVKQNKIENFKKYMSNFDIDNDTEKFLLYVADYITHKEDPSDLIRKNLFFEKVCTRFLNTIPENVQQYWEKIYKSLRKTIPFRERYPYLKTTRDIKIGSKVLIKVNKKKQFYINGIVAENTPFYFTIIFDKKGLEKLFRKHHVFDFFLPQYKDSLYYFSPKVLEIYKGFIKFQHPEEIIRIQRRKSKRVNTRTFVKFKLKSNKKVLNGMMINLSVRGCGVVFTTNPYKNTEGKITFSIGEENLTMDSYIKNVNKLRNNNYYCSIIFLNLTRLIRAKIAKFMKFKQ